MWIWIAIGVGAFIAKKILERKKEEEKRRRTYYRIKQREAYYYRRKAKRAELIRGYNELIRELKEERKKMIEDLIEIRQAFRKELEFYKREGYTLDRERKMEFKRSMEETKEAINLLRADIYRYSVLINEFEMKKRSITSIEELPRIKEEIEKIPRIREGIIVYGRIIKTGHLCEVELPTGIIGETYEELESTPYDHIPVFIDYIDYRNKRAKVSVNKAKIIQTWQDNRDAIFTGIVKEVKEAGSIVQIMGVDCFLPRSKEKVCDRPENGDTLTVQILEKRGTSLYLKMPKYCVEKYFEDETFPLPKSINKAIVCKKDKKTILLLNGGYVCKVIEKNWEADKFENKEKIDVFVERINENNNTAIVSIEKAQMIKELKEGKSKIYKAKVKFSEYRETIIDINGKEANLYSRLKYKKGEEMDVVITKINEAGEIYAKPAKEEACLLYTLGNSDIVLFSDTEVRELSRKFINFREATEILQREIERETKIENNMIITDGIEVELVKRDTRERERFLVKRIKFPLITPLIKLLNDKFTLKKIFLLATDQKDREKNRQDTIFLANITKNFIEKNFNIETEIIKIRENPADYDKMSEWMKKFSKEHAKELKKYPCKCIQVAAGAPATYFTLAMEFLDENTRFYYISREKPKEGEDGEPREINYFREILQNRAKERIERLLDKCLFAPAKEEIDNSPFRHQKWAKEILMILQILWDFNIRAALERFERLKEKEPEIAQKFENLEETLTASNENKKVLIKLMKDIAEIYIDRDENTEAVMELFAINENIIKCFLEEIGIKLTKEEKRFPKKIEKLEKWCAEHPDDERTEKIKEFLKIEKDVLEPLRDIRNLGRLTHGTWHITSKDIALIKSAHKEIDEYIKKYFGIQMPNIFKESVKILREELFHS